jgi:4-amino-4-deoxy-L-arabinose transferase-like glycosyltransferase
MKFGILSRAVNKTNKPLVQTFTKEDNMVFDGKKIIHDDGVTQLKYFSEAIIFPLVFGLFFGLFLIFFLVFGFLGQVFARIFFSFQITVKQGCRLLIVAATPMMVLLFFMLAFNLTFPGYGFMLLAVLAVYFSLGVVALKSESNHLVRS